LHVNLIIPHNVFLELRIVYLLNHFKATGLFTFFKLNQLITF